MQNAAAVGLLIHLLTDAPGSEHASVFKDAVWMLLGCVLRQIQAASEVYDRQEVSLPLVRVSATVCHISGGRLRA